MALNEKNKVAQEAQEQMAGDQDYFDQFTGDGLETFTQDTVSMAYLGMVQPGSGPTLSGHEPGTWRNSSTEENYGPEEEFRVLAFKTVWTERSKDPPYNTVGRYDPRSIEVNVEYPKPGTRGFPKMTNPLTGNKVEELFVYACMRASDPEGGIMYFSPTVGSMRTCKQWNAQLRSQRRPDGKRAAIWEYSWFLTLELVQNPAKPAEKIARFSKVRRGERVTIEVAKEYVVPLISAANNVALLAAPEMSGDTAD